jgi:hypothetical protein
MNSAPKPKKQFDRDKSPFHLLFVMDSKFMTREFPQLEELAKFVKQLSLGWADYGIIHGETVKELPQKELDEDIPDEDLDQPESGIEALSDEDAKELLDTDNSMI